MSNDPAAFDPVFHDPAFYQWFFFRRSDEKALSERQPSTRPREADPYLKHFWDVVEEALKWGGFPPAKPDEVPVAKPGEAPIREIMPHHSCRFVSRDWHTPADTPSRQGQHSYELESRSLLDVFWLHLGQAKRGDYAASKLPPLTAAKHRFPGPEDECFIGEANCLSAEVEEHSLSLKEWRDRAKAMVKAWLPNEPALTPTSDLTLEYGYFAYVEGTAKETLILLLYKRHSGDITRLRGLLLPSLALIYLKLHIIEQEYHEDFSERAIVATKALDNQLKSPVIAGHSLNALEDHATAIAEKHLELLPVIEAIESRLQTLRVNAHNLEEVSRDSAWGTQPSTAATQPSTALPKHKDLILLTAQMESDLHYISIAQKKAEATSQQLQTFASVRVARSERNLTIALAFFAVMAVAQVFPNSPLGKTADSTSDIVWRLVIIGVGFLLVWAVSKLSQGGKVKN